MTAARRTLEEIKAGWDSGDEMYSPLADFPHLLTIAQGQREELGQAKALLAVARSKMIEAAEIAASSYREGQQAPASRKWSESMNYKLALAICQKAAEM